MSAFRFVGLAVVLTGLAACGGARNTAPSRVDPQVISRPVGALEGASVATVRFDQPATVVVAADWAVAGNDVDVFVTAADCFDVPSALSVWSCLTVAQATGATAKPEYLTFAAAAGSSYKVAVLNRGSQADTVTVIVSHR